MKKKVKKKSVCVSKDACLRATERLGQTTRVNSEPTSTGMNVFWEAEIPASSFVFNKKKSSIALGQYKLGPTSAVTLGTCCLGGFLVIVPM